MWNLLLPRVFVYFVYITMFENRLKKVFGDILMEDTVEKSRNVSPVFWGQHCGRWPSSCMMHSGGSSSGRALTVGWSLSYLWCCGCRAGVRSKFQMLLYFGRITFHSNKQLELVNCSLLYRKYMNQQVMTKRCDSALRSYWLFITYTYYSNSLSRYQLSVSWFCRHFWTAGTLFPVLDTDLLGFQASCYILTLAVALYFKACVQLSMRHHVGENTNARPTRRQSVWLCEDKSRQTYFIFFSDRVTGLINKGE